MAKRVLRVGGVHEPFNLPWIRAFDRNAFAHLDVEVTFTDFAGGTGALVEALEEQTIDLATLLTEGAVTAIGRGSDARIHSSFTASPLNWGIHVAHGSDARKMNDVEGRRFAISRRGSGSELMAYVLADDRGWSLDDDRFVVVGGVDGAVDALSNGDADVFLWERFVTTPLVTKKVFRRIGTLATPWPAFYTVARPGLLDAERGLIDEVVQIVLQHANDLHHDTDATIAEIGDRYSMAPKAATSWLDGVAWPSAVTVEEDVLAQATATMVDLGRIERALPVHELL